MRVALVVERFPVLSETFVIDQIDELLQAGADITVIACYPGDNANWGRKIISQCKVIYLAPHGAALFRTLRHLTAFSRLRDLQAVIFDSLYGLGRKLSSSPSYDVIIAHFGVQGVLALRLRQMGFVSGPIVTFFHGYDVSRDRLVRLYANAYIELSLKTELLLPVSNFLEKRLITLGCSDRKMVSRHLGVDTDYFQFQPAPDEMGYLSIISIARLTPKKGLISAIRAVASLSIEGKIDYIIIGEGPQRRELEELIERCGARNRIRLIGAQTPAIVRSYLSRAHLMLLPSVTAANGEIEGIPVSLMEAMACGVVVISTFHSGIPELVSHNQTGFLVGENDIAALSRTIATFVSMTPAEKLQIRLAARALIERDFSRNTQVRDLLSLLDGVSCDA